MRVCTMPKIVVLRPCRWWRQSGVQNMTRIRNSFIKQLIVCGVTQFFKSSTTFVEMCLEITWWLGVSVVRALDSWSRGSGQS